MLFFMKNEKFIPVWIEEEKTGKFDTQPLKWAKKKKEIEWHEVNTAGKT